MIVYKGLHQHCVCVCVWEKERELLWFALFSWLSWSEYSGLSQWLFLQWNRFKPETRLFVKVRGFCSELVGLIAAGQKEGTVKADSRVEVLSLVDMVLCTVINLTVGCYYGASLLSRSLVACFGYLTFGGMFCSALACGGPSLTLTTFEEVTDNFQKSRC